MQSKPFRKMGIHSSRTGELFFHDVRLGRDRLLGETEDNDKGDGRDSARSNFSAERIGVAAMALGVIEECLRLCVDYAKSRTLWGSGDRPVPAHPAQAGEHGSRSDERAQHAVPRHRGRPVGGDVDLTARASAMKWYCSQAATDVAWRPFRSSVATAT